VLGGLALMSITSIVFGFASSIVLLDAARFLQGIGGACSWAGAMAWLVDAAPRERRGELIGTALSAAIVGGLLGPVLGGAARLASPEPVFSSIAVLGTLLAVWAWRTPAAPPPEAQPPRALLSALRSPDVSAGAWLVTLPALLFGTLIVLAPLRLDALGAGGATIAGIFLVAAGLEAIGSSVVGRVSDRRGRLVPIRFSLAASFVVALLLPLPDRTWLLALLVVAAGVAFGMLYAPAMALLSEGAERVGLDQGFAFALTNLAWAGGQVMGAAAGSRLAEATADAVPFAILAGACLATLTALGRRALRPGVVR
jgi:MFS family permease